MTSLAAGQYFKAGMLKPLQGILDGSLNRLIMPYSMTEKAMQSIPFFCKKVIFFREAFVILLLVNISWHGAGSRWRAKIMKPSPLVSGEANPRYAVISLFPPTS